MQSPHKLPADLEFDRLVALNPLPRNVLRQVVCLSFRNEGAVEYQYGIPSEKAGVGWKLHVATIRMKAGGVVVSSELTEAALRLAEKPPASDEQ
ncbi:hypothetical protein PLCT2_01944 [Planctomycetaceae bacterium]|nr:hypothetical protein PLCT2_01944 [Planctomycetaceae bacterium]